MFYSTDPSLGRSSTFYFCIFCFQVGLSFLPLQTNSVKHFGLRAIFLNKLECWDL